MKRFWIYSIAPLTVLSFCAAAPAQLKSAGDSQDSGIGQIVQYAEVMEKYLYVVDHLARLADNPTAAGVAAVMSANDLLKNKPQDAIGYFTNLLPDVKNQSVKRAIRLQLADLYRKTDQPEKALEQMRELIVSVPPSGRPAGTPRLPAVVKPDSTERRPPPVPTPQP